MTVQEVIKILALLTLASNLGLVLLGGLGILGKLVLRLRSGSARKWEGYYKRVRKILYEKAVFFSFIVALTATGGSLFLSEVAHFEPCVLCWYQRIFMYPLVIILGMSLRMKYKDIWQYVLPMTVIGGFIALYHYFLQLKPDAFVPCSAVGFSVSCSRNFFTYFGYITIPWMSFSAFVLITTVMFLLKMNKK